MAVPSGKAYYMPRSPGAKADRANWSKPRERGYKELPCVRIMQRLSAVPDLDLTGSDLPE